MKKYTHHDFLFALTALASLGSVTAPASAQTVQVVTLDTSALTPGDAYAFDFQLLDGALTGDGNSTVTLSGLTATGLAYDPAQAVLTGLGASGGFPAAVTLTDSDLGGVDEFTQPFTVTAGSSQVQFTVRLDPVGLDMPTPDTFSFSVLDSAGTPLPTNGPTGGEMLSSRFTSLPPVFDTPYQTVDTANSPRTPFLSPTLTNPVPEASSVVSFGLLLALGLGGAFAAACKKKAV